MNKKILLISRHAPYGSNTAREAIDAALAASIYDQDLSILFMDDGVFQLLREQNAQGISQKNIAAILSSLPLYGVENIYVHQESLTQRCITHNELALEDLKLLSSIEITALLSQQEHILSF